MWWCTGGRESIGIRRHDVICAQQLNFFVGRSTDDKFDGSVGYAIHRSRARYTRELTATITEHSIQNVAMHSETLILAICGLLYWVFRGTADYWLSEIVKGGCNSLASTHFSEHHDSCSFVVDHVTDFVYRFRVAGFITVLVAVELVKRRDIKTNKEIKNDDDGAKTDTHRRDRRKTTQSQSRVSPKDRSAPNVTTRHVVPMQQFNRGFRDVNNYFGGRISSSSSSDTEREYDRYDSE